MAGPLSCGGCGKEFEKGELVLAVGDALIQKEGADDDGPYLEDNAPWADALCVACWSKVEQLLEWLHPAGLG